MHALVPVRIEGHKGNVVTDSLAHWEHQGEKLFVVNLRGTRLVRIKHLEGIRCVLQDNAEPKEVLQHDTVVAHQIEAPDHHIAKTRRHLEAKMGEARLQLHFVHTAAVCLVEPAPMNKKRQQHTDVRE